MKLIRSFMENKQGDGTDMSPPQAPVPPRAGSRSSVPISDALKARSVISDGLDRKLKAFKSDLADLAPKAMADAHPLRPKRAWDDGLDTTPGVGESDANPQNDPDQKMDMPLGWLVIVQGPGRGAAFVLQNAVTWIGRALDQTVTLNFGDDTISRQHHASVTYDDQHGTFCLSFGKTCNLVQLNGQPVLDTQPLTHGDLIRVGETELKFAALCGPEFSWHEDAKAGSDD